VNSWILRTCRRACVRQLVAWAVVAVVGIVLVAANLRYFTNFVTGPFVMGPSELARIVDPTQSPQYFARVSGTRAIDTGIQQITIRKQGDTEVSRSVSAGYYVLDLGEKLLIVKSASGQPLSVEGELARIPADLDHQLFDTPEMQSLRDRFYPFYLDAGSFRTAGYVTIALWLTFLGLAGWKVLPTWRKLQDLGSHPIVRRVASWGDPVQVSAEIKREWTSPGIRRHGSWTLTPSYLVKSSYFGFDVLRFWDLLWAYRRVTKRSVNFIPIGKNYHAVFICYGGSATVQGSDKEVDEMLQSAAQRAPWAIFGYSDELQKAFNEHTRDFCLAVEERRRKVYST
jgi:hypothetical protein